MRLLGLGILLAMMLPGPAAADPLRIALIEDYADAARSAAIQGEEGFRLGLDYATHGTRAVGGHPLAVTIVQSHGAEDAASQLAASYRDGKADIAVASGPSEDVIAMLSVAASSKHILLVATARADLITGGNRYVFRTAASAGQQALAEALALARPELNLFVAAEDTRDGADAVAALKTLWGDHGDGGFLIGSRLVPPGTTDVGTLLSAEFDGLHDLHGGRTLLTIWSSSPPIQSIAATDPGRFGVRLAFGGDIDPNAPLPQTPIEGITSYFHTMPHNRENDWLVAAWRRRHRTYPDGAVADGMTAALALVSALRAASTPDADALVASLEGLHFATPKGGMIFRKEDHQAMQVMYQFRSAPHAPTGAPVLAHEFTIAELASASPLRSPDRHSP